MKSADPRPWETDELFGKVLFVAGLLHLAATLLSVFVLFVLTRGGGDGPPDSPAIRAAWNAAQILAMPVAWSVDRFVELAIGSSLLAFLAFVALRIVNSALIGAVVAWAWVKLRRGWSARGA